MNLKPLKFAGVVSMIMGILFTITGGVVWGLVTSQLAAEKITVSADAPFAGGSQVQDPISAYAQAEAINMHALKGSKGLTYAELGAAATAAKNEATKAKEAGDLAKAEELTAQSEEFTKQRTTAMNGSFLRASLFTSVLSYGVCLFAIGIGLTLIVVGWAFTKVARSAS
ncbi:MAG: aromatic ring-opening dioxygenase LigA [Propioniciclava sp.]|uniref:aromatic ring-opening dioxygenase LigA n=1 Tax=Propioniciclava sp. TaxID=2038686 RepID=UPI0039E30A57